MFLRSDYCLLKTKIYHILILFCYFIKLQKIIDYLTCNESEKMREISAASKTRLHIYRVPDKPNSLLVRGLQHQIEVVRNILKQFVISEDEMADNSNRTSSAVAKNGQPVFERLEATSSDG